MSDPLRIDLANPTGSVRAIMRTAVRLYGRYPLLFLILAVVVVAPWDLAFLAITGIAPLSHSGENARAFLIDLIGHFVIVTPLISALHLHAVGAAGRGEGPRLHTVARQGLRVLPVVAAASVVSGIGIALGFFALVIPGIWLSLRWAVVAQVAAAEPVEWTGALKRGASLTRNNYPYVFVVQLVAVTFTVLVTLGARAVHLSADSPSAVALGVGAQTLAASFGALTLALLYFDLAARPVREQRTPEYQHLRDLD